MAKVEDLRDEGIPKEEILKIEMKRLRLKSKQLFLELYGSLSENLREKMEKARASLFKFRSKCPKSVSSTGEQYQEEKDQNQFLIEEWKRIYEELKADSGSASSFACNDLHEYVSEGKPTD